MIEIMRKVLFIFCLMTAIAASAQNEERMPDAMAVDSVSVDSLDQTEQGIDIVEVEWSDRYAVAEKDGKYGIIDVKADSLVTDIVFDEAYPAFRKRVFSEYITYFSIRQGDRLGIVGIFESTGSVTTILAPQEDEKALKKEEDE